MSKNSILLGKNPEFWPQGMAPFEHEKAATPTDKCVIGGRIAIVGKQIAIASWRIAIVGRQIA
jgi:hypothetical protein